MSNWICPSCRTSNVETKVRCISCDTNKMMHRIGDYIFMEDEDEHMIYIPLSAISLIYVSKNNDKSFQIAINTCDETYRCSVNYSDKKLARHYIENFLIKEQNHKGDKK